MPRLRFFFTCVLLAGWILGPVDPGWVNFSQPPLPPGSTDAKPAFHLVCQGAESPPGLGYRLNLHPDGEVYVGDQISIEVIPPPGEETIERWVEVQVDAPAGITFGPVEFAPFGIGGRQQATFWWAWDTRKLEPGDHTLTIRILPDGPQWTEVVHLTPALERHRLFHAAKWEMVETDCCEVYYITDTSIDRDLARLLDIAEQQTRSVELRLGVERGDPIPLILIPRLLGHGGFVSNEIYMSYLDRNYAGNHPGMVLHHEIVHMLDGRLGGQLRPSILVEGLAVYLTGGHYKDEPLLARAAVLEDIGLYLPLAALTDQFYNSQHEISYLEAGALVEYMVNTWGFERYMAFYRDIPPHPSGGQAQAMDQALQAHFNLTMDQLERQFLTTLRRFPVIPDLRSDVVLTMRFFDTLRRYQQLLDPSAYFLSAWVPSVSQMRERGLVADYVRTPSEPENMALEALLVAAEEHLQAGHYPQVERILGGVNAVLDAYECGDPVPFEAHSMTSAAMAIVRITIDDGRIIQKIQINGNRANVWVGDFRGDRTVVAMVKRGDQWETQ